MKFTDGAKTSVAAPPVVAFDPRSPLAGYYLTAVLGWPKDRRMQLQALATYAAQHIAFSEKNGNRIAHEMFKEAVAMAAKHMGVSEEEVLAMPQARPLAERLLAQVPKSRPFVEKVMLGPAGGYQTLAEAPGVAALKSHLSTALDGPLSHVGRALLLVAVMSRHDAKIPASLNRAFAVMEATGPHVGRPKVSERTLKDHWKDWRGIAPLAAALCVWDQQGPDTDEHGADAFASMEGIFSLLSWAKWFRDFGTTFTPHNGQAPLLTEADTVAYDVPEVPATTPPLVPLSVSELGAAMRYRSPTLKSGY